ncbi:MAG: hypothetical protein AAGC68_09760 [Verrucomicrobiota bacterium]
MNRHLSAFFLLSSSLLTGSLSEDRIRLTADYSRIAPYPLQKSQFGVSYVEPNETTYANVFGLLKARHVRNNDKRLRSTWGGWDEKGDPIYKAHSRVSGLLIEASRKDILGGANLQGPIEHPDLDSYLLDTRKANLWDWAKYSRDSRLYHQHLRSEIDSSGRQGFPFVFGIGHEANNDASIDTLGLEEGCLDGIAFMGNLPAFQKLLLDEEGKAWGDVVQARQFFEWYWQTMNELMIHYGSRDAFLISAAQPHTQAEAMTTYFKTIYDLINEQSHEYIPDYIGSHARWNLPGENRFFKTIVEPSRGLFGEFERWQAVPLMCNEFGANDYNSAYDGTLRGAVSLLSNYERMLQSPDVAYVNFIYNRYFEEKDGRQLHPAFHAFRFYQDMPQSRTRLTGEKPRDLHVLSSRAVGSRQDALLWRDETEEGSHTIDFTFTNLGDEWTVARASLYILKARDPGRTITSPRSEEDFGLARYLAKGYPREIHRRKNLEAVTFSGLELPPASIAMLRLERLDREGNPIPDKHLYRSGPDDARYVKSWQWTARSDEGTVDPSWGFFDHRNWTLFAGVAALSGKGGSAPAEYRNETEFGKAKRGLAGAEFYSGSATLQFDAEMEFQPADPEVRRRNAFAGIRIDFYNGRTGKYDAALMWAGKCCPVAERYQRDHIPWGFGGDDASVVPQDLRLGLAMNGSSVSIDLDEEYCELTGNKDAQDFVAGGRRIIVSAWVENVRGGLVVRLGGEK